MTDQRTPKPSDDVPSALPEARGVARQMVGRLFEIWRLGSSYLTALLGNMKPLGPVKSVTLIGVGLNAASELMKKISTILKQNVLSDNSLI